MRRTERPDPPGFARPTWWVLADLLNAIGENTNCFVAGDVFAALAKDVAPFSGLTYQNLGLKGRESS